MYSFSGLVSVVSDEALEGLFYQAREAYRNDREKPGLAHQAFTRFALVGDELIKRRELFVGDDQGQLHIER